MTKLYEKCDKCKRWALGCELDGQFRRHCIDRNYKWFIPIEPKILDDWHWFFICNGMNLFRPFAYMDEINRIRRNNDGKNR